MTADNNEEKLREYLRRVTVELHRTKARLQEQEAVDSEPVAIVGVACRLPGGVATPDDLWRLLADGKSAIVDFPRNRGWDVDALYDPDPERKGTSTVRRGGFLDNISDFDAEFFGISPREALATDPQQRLMLEVVWEALERSRLDPTSLAGSQTGVFLGLWHSGYATSSGRIAEEIEGYMSIGASSSVASGRIAYTLGLHGPTLSVDTACSSSLVALHLASRALKARECSLALAGGVTLMATPSMFVEFSRQRNLAPDGVCKPFSARADGTSWSEGAVALVLERESDAKRNGRRILGLIRGSAVNQDGRSQGLTAPNGPAQREVIRQALASAQLTPNDITVVETHGTGTTLGDPIEAQALIGVYGAQRPAEDPLWLGTLKSNLGHTQAAAGIAGIIKLLLAFEHEQLPKNLYAEDPTPHVDWGNGSVRLVRDALAWPRGEKARRGAVSSFGFSGTNAHVIVEEPPRAEVSPEESHSPSPEVLPFVLSARSERALSLQAARLAQALPDAPLADLARALVHQRSRFDVRAVVLARDAAQLSRELAALAADEARPSRRARRAAFLFTGQGSQRAAMGRALYQHVPAFRNALDEVFASFAGKLPEPLETVLFAAPGSPRAALLDQTQYTQAGLFALEVALYRTLTAWGVKPAFLLGHSVGEIAAAHVASVLSLGDACTLVAARGSLMQALPGGGKMAAITAQEQELGEHLRAHAGRLSLAAVNGPRSLVVSGDGAAVDAVAAAFRAEGREVRELVVSHAFHSAHMDAMLEPFRRTLKTLRFAPAQIPIASNVTGRIAPPELHASPDYWVEQVRAAVRFHDGVCALDAAGANAYLELGPRGILSALVDATLGERATSVHALSRSEGDELEHLLRALGDFHALGGEVDWRAYFGAAGPGVELPTYPFDRERFWLETPPALDANAVGLHAIDHPLLGASTLIAEGESLVFSGRLRLDQVSWLPDHAVFGRAILPGTAFAELACAAGRRVGLERLEELVLQAPLALTGEAMQLQVVLAPPDEQGARAITIHARAEQGGPMAPWQCHARGALTEALPAQEMALHTWPPHEAEAVPLGGLYARLAESGLQYGPTFQGLRALYRAQDGDYAEVTLPDGARPQAPRYGLHPALLDAALHALALITRDDEVRLPFAWRGLTMRRTGSSALRVRLQRDQTGQKVRLTIWDDAGFPIGDVEELTLRPARAAAAPARDARDLYRVSWAARELPARSVDFALLGASTELAPAVAYADVSALRTALTNDARPALLVIDASSGGALDASAARNAEDRATELLAVLRALLADVRLSETKLVVLTERATSCNTADPIRLDQAALAGLLRSAQNEHGERALSWLDWDACGASREVLVRAFDCAENQVALRAGSLLVPRLVRAESEALAELPDGTDYALLVEKPGTIDGLAFKRVAPRELAPREVRVAVRATGLNFRDVLASLGMYPGDPGPLGYEGSGVVVEVGSAVSTLVPGERVMGLFSRGFSPSVVEDERRLVRVPRGVSMTDAAGVPLVFLTALYALCDLAEVKRGEKLLVHAAAGGVGMAAVQLAQHLGLEVFGTSSEAKRRHLRALGLADDHIASSRDLSFEPAIRAVSGGVDVVLDSLAGDFVDASLRTLKPGGRFIEMGKADVRDPAQVAVAHGGVRYRAFDLSEAGLDRTQAMLRDLLGLFEEGALRPLPTTRWDLRDARDAFHTMAQAKHVGKIVLSMPQPVAGVRADGRVLITGGGGALAGALARHLFAKHDVRDFVLCSRRGGGHALKHELEARGARVELAVCDVSDREALARLLASIGAERPLTAVFHAAGVLDDGVLLQQDGARMARVFAPKVHGAWNLHELTLGHDLAAFVLFSSLSGVLGGAGQSNYAAANTFLDGLAARRRAEGLAGLSLAWGLWAEEGGMGGTIGEADLARLASSGLRALPSDEALSLLDLGLRRREALLVPTGFTRAFLAGALGNSPPVLSDLVRGATKHTSKVGGSFAEQLTALPAEARARHVLDHVRTTVCAVLRSDAAQIVADRPLKDLGLDSLMAVELRNRLATLTGLRLPSTLLFDHPTPQALAELLLKKLARDSEPRPHAQTPPRGEQTADDEPIAIVSMSCRYADGVDSPEALWQLLVDARDAMSDPPLDRGWDLASLYDPDPEKRGTTTVLRAAYLHEAAAFDAGFFGISPRESLAMDPQQRLLLRSAWEVFERAGIDPASLRGKPTGVYVGLWANGYGAEGARSAPPELEGFMAIGTAASVASGRIAYCLGLEGPAVTVDTACSSSLVAIHLACQALRHGDCDLALAGGVTVMATPATFIEFSRQRNLAHDGRCKAFSADADGTAWGEGVGMIALERLSDARKNGHPVLAIVRGSAINQDGRSQGLTAPNGPAQEGVIAQALAHGKLRARDVDVVEAHGTGTVLGDPIEAQALLAVYGRDRSADAPLWLGSLKSNLGHTQAAAGVGGVIKMVLAMQHGLLPKTLYADTPTPHVDWTQGHVKLLQEAEPWPSCADRPRRAGVSSFGMSGTNAHVLVEEAPRVPAHEASPPPADTPRVFVLSARSEAALAGQAARLHALLDARPDITPADVAWSLARTRVRFAERALWVASDRASLVQTLADLSQRTPPAHALVARADVDGKVVFVCPGQGGQWLGMGRALLAQSPVFAANIDACDAALRPHTGWSVRDMLARDEEALLENLDTLQPLLFAIMISLAALWREHGVVPDAVVGHSQGEVAAAHIAGALSLADAARIVAVRSKALEKLHGRGSMAVVESSVEGLAPFLTKYGAALSIGAVNSAHSTIVSGDPDALTMLAEDLASAEIVARRMRVHTAGHCAQVDALRDEMLRELADITPMTSRIPLYSTVTRERIDGDLLDAHYWFRNARETVHFAAAMARLIEDGHRFFVELSPHMVLRQAVEHAGVAADTRVAYSGSLRRDDGGIERFLLSFAQLHARGLQVDLARLAVGGSFVALPTYAFQEERFWLTSGKASGDASALGLTMSEHPLVAASSVFADGSGALLTTRLARSSHAFLYEHTRGGRAAVCESALVEMALTAARTLGLDLVAELSLEAPLFLPERGALVLQIAVGASDDNRRTLQIFAREDGDEGADWRRYAVGSLALASEAVLLEDPASSLAQEVEPSSFFVAAADRGVQHGNVYRCIEKAAYRGDELELKLTLPVSLAEEAERTALHPALLAAVCAAAQIDAGPDSAVVRWQGIRVVHPGASDLLVRVRFDGTRSAASLHIRDAAGAPVAHVARVEFGPLAAGSEERGTRRTDAMHALEWLPVGRPDVAPFDALIGALPEISDLTRYTDFAALAADIARGGAVPKRVLLACLGAPHSGDAAVARANVVSVLGTLQAWLADERLAESELVILTRGAVAVREDDRIDLAYAGVWGLVRSVQSEHPDAAIRIVDLDPSEPESVRWPVAASSEEPQLAQRGDTLVVPRLARKRVAAGDLGADAVAGTVLITGGTGALGAALARHLVARHGARRLLLCSRGGKGEALRDELSALGAHVQIAACDVSRRDDVVALLARVDPAHPLSMVVHTAGAIEDGVLKVQSADSVGRVFAPKVDGALHLDELTRAHPVQAFVLFSSFAGIVGGRGQANYAAANSVLDALAQARRVAGLPAQSLAWGFWAEKGALSAHLSEADIARLARGGVQPLELDEGLALFDAALASGLTQLVPARLKARLLRSGGETAPAVLRALSKGKRAARASSLRARLHELPESERHGALVDAVRGAVAAILGGKAGDIDPQRTLTELGMDSLMAVELRNQLAALTGLRMPGTLVFDYRTPDALARYVLPRFHTATDGASPAAKVHGTPLLAMVAQAVAASDQVIAWQMIDFATRQRRNVEPQGHGIKARIHRIASGEGGPHLVCLPSPVPPHGPQQYLRLANALGGRHDVSVLSFPGYAPNEPLFATLDGLLACLAETTLACAGGRPFALLGYSGGGYLAYELGHYLERNGVLSEGVVLLDTPIQHKEIDSIDGATGLPNWRAYFNLPSGRSVGGRVMGDGTILGGIGEPTCDEELSAMARYLGALIGRYVEGQWTPYAGRTRTLMVQCTDAWNVPGTVIDIPPSARWHESHDLLTMPGDHFTFMADHAAVTAAAVSQWLADDHASRRAAE